MGLGHVTTWMSMGLGHNATAAVTGVALIPLSASLEIKKKLYSSILVVGGGLSFANINNMLNARLQLKLPIVLTKGVEDMEIFTNPRVMIYFSPSMSSSPLLMLLLPSPTTGLGLLHCGLEGRGSAQMSGHMPGAVD